MLITFDASIKLDRFVALHNSGFCGNEHLIGWSCRQGNVLFESYSESHKPSFLLREASIAAVTSNLSSDNYKDYLRKMFHCQVDELCDRKRKCDGCDNCLPPVQANGFRWL